MLYNLNRPKLAVCSNVTFILDWFETKGNLLAVAAYAVGGDHSEAFVPPGYCESHMTENDGLSIFH